MLDIQGPFDNASIIWGSGIYYAFYDAPEKLHQLMGLIADTILAVVEEHRRIDGGSPHEHGGQWNHLGGLCVRNDSSVNLSTQQYAEFAQPYDQQLLKQYGGWIHFCGKAHWWQALLGLSNLKGINPYQGEFYDMLSMYETCEQAGVPIVQWTSPVTEICRERIRTGFSRIVGVRDYEEACRAKDHLYATGHADGF
jgi:uroporphyrinogen-III decarboxylase